MTHDRRLIEDSLPLEAISFQSAREKSIRHGHISTLHIWWARRPLAAMRAAIFASLVPAPRDEKEREYLHQLVADIADWDHVKDGNSPRIEEAKALIRKYHPDGPPKVLDPFMGGGSTGLEALRLGCEAHGVELNPVAYLIELCTLVYPQKYGQLIPRGEYESRPGTLPPPESDASGQHALNFESDEMINPLAEDVRRWGLWVLEQARAEIGHLYEDPEGRTIVGYIWARTAKCPNPACGAEMPMVHQWWLVKKSDRKVAVHPVVDHEHKTVSFEIAEDDEIDFDPDDGTMRRGSIRCEMCGQSPNIDYLREEGRSDRLGTVPMAVIYDRPNQSGKGYRGVDDFDKECFEQAARLLGERLEREPDAAPNEPLPPYGTLGFRVNNYGLTQWDSLFNARQILSLLVFLEEVLLAYDSIADVAGDPDYARAVATYLAFAIDKLADRNSTLCRWISNAEKPAGTFGRQALPMVWDYVETNLIAGSWGWLEQLDWILKGIEHFSLTGRLTAKLYQGNAARLGPYDSLVDSVITDPPYYDAVPYADLSDFFYVWLKRSVGALYPDIFVTPLTPKSSEIIQEPARHESADKAKQFYESQMTKAFSEAQHVLEPEGIFIVVFAHKSTSAWETLINSLLQAGLVVTASWPLHTERPGRLRAMDSAALASSIFIVCRKRTADAEGFYDDVQADLRAHINERLDFFWRQGIRGADFFISAIGPAVSVFGQYRQVRKLTGEVVTAAELLDLVQERVADYALGKVMNGRYRMGTVDAPTRFYVMYRWSYGAQKLPFDDARRLAQGIGAEVDELMHRLDLLKQSGEDVTLLGPRDRSKDEHLGETGRDGMASPLIDVLHRSVLLWQSGDRRALAEFLAVHAMGREDGLHAVAQALVNVLPDGDRERQLLEGFLTGQDNLPDVPYSPRLPGME
jgi:putative DNA methylase